MRKEIFDRLSADNEAQEKTAGGSMAGIVALPDPLRQLVNWITRQNEVRFAQVVAHTGQDEAVVRTTLDTLVEQGFVRETDVAGESCYRIRLAPKRGRELPRDIWQLLDVYQPAVYQEPAPIFDQENPFQSMMERFDYAANILQLDPGLYKYLKTPTRIHITAVPVIMDDGHLEVFEGIRVLHSEVPWARQGRSPLCPRCDPRRGQGLGGMDDLEMRRGRDSVRWRQRRGAMQSAGDEPERT